MFEIIAISWAASAISMAILKPIIAAAKTRERIKKDGHFSASAVIDSVREVQRAEKTAYEKTARALCGGDNAPDELVKPVSWALRGTMAHFTPSPLDLLPKKTRIHGGGS
jgi:hypothetical protein